MVMTAAAVVTVGCSHDTLGSGTQELAVLFNPSPSGIGRFERGSFDIIKLEALPVDPNSAAIFGTDRLTFRFDRFQAVLTNTGTTLFSTIGLAEGTYRVTLFQMSMPSLVDTNVSTTPATCSEGVATVDVSSAPGVPAIVNFADEPSLTFTVHPGQSTLLLTLDVPGFVDDYLASFTCQFGCGPGGAPCFTAFSTPAFKNAVVANLTIQ
jgi:hypothetical protein